MVGVLSPDAGLAVFRAFARASPTNLESVPAYAFPAPLQSTSLAGLWAVVWMSPQITAHNRRSGNVVPLCLGTALRLIFDCSAYCPAHRHPQERGNLTAAARYVRPFVLLACPVQLFSRGALFLVPPVAKRPRCDETSRLPFVLSHRHGLLGGAALGELPRRTHRLGFAGSKFRPVIALAARSLLARRHHAGSGRFAHRSQRCDVLRWG